MLSNKNDCRLSVKKFLYEEKLHSSSTNVIGANRMKVMSSKLRSSGRDILEISFPLNIFEMAHNISKPVFYFNIFYLYYLISSNSLVLSLNCELDENS